MAVAKPQARTSAGAQPGREDRPSPERVLRWFVGGRCRLVLLNHQRAHLGPEPAPRSPDLRRFRNQGRGQRRLHHGQELTLHVTVNGRTRTFAVGTQLTEADLNAVSPPSGGEVTMKVTKQDAPLV